MSLAASIIANITRIINSTEKNIPTLLVEGNWRTVSMVSVVNTIIR